MPEKTARVEGSKFWTSPHSIQHKEDKLKKRCVGHVTRMADRRSDIYSKVTREEGTWVT
jgi:hypothetical protein